MLTRRAFLQVTALAGLSAWAIGATGCDKKTVAVDGADASLITSFVVMGDPHIVRDAVPECEQNLKDALNDAAALAVTPCVVVMNGDLTDGGMLLEYDKVNTSIAECGLPRDRFMFAIGNHDHRWEDEETFTVQQCRDRFAEQMGLERLNYDRFEGGQHFIVLAPDVVFEDQPETFEFSADQVQWLDNLLAQDEQTGTNSFVFSHMPFRNTINGTKEGQYGYRYSVTNSEEVVGIFKKYTNVFVFTAHLHGYPTFAEIANGVVVAQDGCVLGCRPEGGSKSVPVGLVVNVYKDHLDMIPRNFRDGEYLPNDTFTYTL